MIPAIHAAAPGAHLPVTDATPAFFNFWRVAQGKPEGERVRLFQKMVVAPRPELFSEAVLNQSAVSGDAGKGHSSQVIAAYLRDVAPYVPAMGKIAATIHGHLDAYARDFAGRFPDYAAATPIYFTVSLFCFDGGTRSVEGKTALLFGIDSIARFHGPDENLKVLFDHELFHQYRDQIDTSTDNDDTPLWMSLWEEGLATYVSQQMNPGSTEAQALISPTLGEAARRMTGPLAQELLANLDSVDRKEYAAFFYVKNDRADLPPRSGYYVGYRIAGMLARGRTLQALAKLQGPDLKVAVKQALTELAKT